MNQAYSILAAATIAAAPTAPAWAIDSMAEPLYTKSAQRHDGFVFELYVETYKGRDFQEIESVDATELRADIVIPILDRSQLRLSVPFYTDGDGRRIKNGNKIDIDGNGGTLNFATLNFEHPISWGDREDVQLMAYAGLGYRTDRLETSDNDRMNHRGKNAVLGARMTRRIMTSTALLADVGFRYYWDTDDLDPTGESDNFGHVLASAALIKQDQALQPAVELTYRGDFSDYNNLALVPELVYSHGPVDVKLGVPVGLSSDADDYGVTLGFTYRM